MIVQQTLCLGGSEFILLIIYALFAYWGSRRDNFYQARRWKASVWIAIISSFMILALICLPVLWSIYKNFVETHALNFDSLWATISTLLVIVIPLMFIITISAYSRLAWSDDFLDKIWKDPNKGNKSPIQPF
jgi:hypothetical protein